MATEHTNVRTFLEQLPEDRLLVVNQFKQTIENNIPTGFEIGISYKMLAWNVPHSIYPKGYHCDPKQALPFVSLASQKAGISLYHMGIYADPQLMEWFKNEYKLRVDSKLDMGKSCIRFKKLDSIPYELIGELMSKMSVDQWIKIYENSL